MSGGSERSRREGTAVVDKISAFSTRLDELRQRVEHLRGSGQPPGDTYHELLQAMEELQVAEEELRQQHEELTGTHHALEEERRRYQHLFHYAPDAYLLTDLGGIVREANLSSARLLGVKPRFLIGKTVVSFVALEDRPRIRAELSRWRSEPTPKALELRLQPRTGPPLHAAITLSVARGGAKDTAIGFRWLVRDISAQRQLTDELKYREQAARREAEASEARARHVQKLESIGVLAGGIAHDFNNLLHVVLGNADLARLLLAAEDPAREHLDEVIRATQRAAELTQQLLAYSGRGSFEVRHLDLSSEVRDMAMLLRTGIAKHATLVWQLEPDLPAVMVDPTQLRQVVMNLITNASDALAESPGTITLRTGRTRERGAFGEESSFVFLEVADTGCGMDTDTLQRIFDPFFSTKFAGRGLGLAAVMGIVESHKGLVQIHTSPGQGTTFRVLLPAVADGADVPAHQASGSYWRGRGTALVVEDEEGVGDVVGRMLERLGFEVRPAKDGVEALELLEREGDAITLVLLDLSMPRMGGADCLHHIRRRWPDLPVVLMSGYTEQEIASRLLAPPDGAAGFLQKPFLPQDLTSVLRHLPVPLRT
jgi:two-component system cell cycle sensor histidine kinase/response regulator CckA